MSAVPNAYPELPEVLFARTTVAMPDAIDALRAVDALAEVQRTAYIIFRNESSNGRSGVNNNYAGVQADGSRWPPELTHLFAGTVVLPENGTGKTRRFVAFADAGDCLAFLCNRVQSRGLFVGGTTHLVVTMTIRTPTDLARAYQKEWVRGSAAAEPDAEALEGFLSMYWQAQGLFV